MTQPKANRIAVFVDAENVTNWIKRDGVRLLMEELNQIGQIIIRRAYGVWSKPNLAMHQAAINQSGFELIHCYHPVSGKNTADIQMTVDVIECAWQLPNISCFVLVTGDSDFTPVFRRLREMDKDVIGVGQHSTLSECVKTSCTRFIYTDEVINTLVINVVLPQAPLALQPLTNSQPTLTLAKADEWVIAHLKASPTPVNASQIKTLLKQHAADFDEKHYGFKTFTDYLKANDAIEVSKSGTVNFANLAKSVQPTEKTEVVASAEGYKALLKKYNALPDNADTLKIIFKHAVTLKDICTDPAQFRTALFILCHKADPNISKTTVNKAFSYFMVMGLVHTEKAKGGVDAVRVKKMVLKDFLLKSDKLVIAKLLELGKTQALDLKAKEIKKLLLSTISKDSIKKLIGE
ncbi:NYN domain-containing protein [Methylicorpusculum oleiharenae]|uniref:NYN domain-containing protein n=1 Tax=Methylicorpusculum oleiharenae TaxID=1338687 RepID=UPI00135C6244|nr:NYN domain-containing protein [Methylicorpusculum oleiharenae]MCD2450534.1 NYN domain-containing protein [Methylicorpusculum oleiharenae]